MVATEKPKAARLVRYEERTTVLMLALALLFLAVYSLQIIWRTIPETLSDWLGYANYSEGRIVAGALMVVGISVLGAVTATAASWFIRSGDEATEEIEGRDQKILAANQERLAEQIAGLEAKIDRLLQAHDEHRPPSSQAREPE